MSSLEQRARESWRTRWQHQASAAGTRSRLERVVSIIGADLELGELTTGDVERLVADLEGDGLADSTVNRHLAILSAICADARADGEAVGDHRLLYRPEPEGRLRWFSEKEVSLLELWGGRLGGLFRFLADTGMRPSEALRLKWEDLDLEAGRARVWRSKTGKARLVPLTRRAIGALELMVQEKPYSLRGGPWDCVSIRTVQRQFAKAKWRVPSLNGDRSATLYTLRHTCASRLVEAGVHLRTVGEWLGHSSIRTTQRYAHVADSMLESARDCLDAMGTEKKKEKEA